MNVAELMLRHQTESRLLGGGLQHVAQQLRLAQRFAATVPEHQIGCCGPRHAFAVSLKCRNRVTAERNRPHRLQCLWRLELPLEYRFAHCESAVFEIEGGPEPGPARAPLRRLERLE